MEKKDVLDAAKALGEGAAEKAKVSKRQLVTFVLDGEEFAAPVGDVREVVMATDIVPVPNAPTYVRGLMNVRGKIAVVVDPELLLGLQREGTAGIGRHVVIVESDGGTYGFAVDGMPMVLHVPVDRIRPPAASFKKKIGPDILTGVVLLGDENERQRMLMQVNLPKLLSQDELRKVTAILQDDSSH